jgi:hypothetical protein
MRAAFLAIGLAGCAGAAVSMVVKPPLQSQCQRLPIKGCGELVDGVLLYVEGDKPGALEKIKQAKDANEPAQLKAFAKALRGAASLPGAEDYAASMNEVAALLDSGGAVRPTAEATANEPGDDQDFGLGGKRPKVDESGATQVSKSKAVQVSTQPVLQPDPSTRALSATVDLVHLMTETVDLSTADGRSPCKVAGLDALCIKAKEGPIVVTDVIGARACPERVFVVSTLTDSPDFGLRWSFEPGPIALTGARLVVRGGEWLQLAIVPGKKGASNSPECVVTWSGFRPWILPGTSSEADPSLRAPGF